MGRTLTDAAVHPDALAWKAAATLRLAALRGRVGHTPLLPIRELFQKPGVRLFAKAEWKQIGGSVKARAAYRIVHQAVASGALRPGRTLLDASSGNTAIAYAHIAREAGIPVAICLPENATPERHAELRRLGATIIPTSPFEGTDGAQQAARELVDTWPDRYHYADQYANPDNHLAHYHGTALEILEQTEGAITHFICGLGTTGTFTGTGRRLKETDPAVWLTALQPDAALHGLEGWKHLPTARVPAIYDDTVPDAHAAVDTLAAYDMMRDALRHEGLRLSPSAAANLVGAIALAQRLDAGTVVTILPDNADRYGELADRYLGSAT